MIHNIQHKPMHILNFPSNARGAASGSAAGVSNDTNVVEVNTSLSPENRIAVGSVKNGPKNTNVIDAGTSPPLNWAEKVIKLEKENEDLRKTVRALNQRIGDDILTEDSDDSIGEDPPESKNTRHYQLDSQFARSYYFITDVSKIIWYIG